MTNEKINIPAGRVGSKKLYTCCRAPLEVYPEWKYCVRPVRLPDTRCERHQLKNIWGDE